MSPSRKTQILNIVIAGAVNRSVVKDARQVKKSAH